jgi:Ca2+-binding EF-hand superfamily protein
MNRALRLSLLGVLALAIVASAAGPPAAKPAAKPVEPVEPAAKAPEVSDKLDYVFLATDRPVLIRVHLRAGDKPYSVVWEAWMDKLFTWFDKDGDGFLNSKEAARLQPAQFLQFMLQGSIGGGRGQAVPFAQLDTNKDGKVSKEEFRAYYRKNGIGPLRFNNQNYQATQAKQINDSIYKRLDVAPTGKLTHEKLARLPDLLRSLDENEDEMLSSSELSLEGPNPYERVVRARPGRMPAAAGPAMESGLLEIGTIPAPSLAQQILARYDKNKKGKLTRTEIALDEKLFNQLDANHDGFLDAGELAAFFKREPDLVFRTRVGAVGTVASALARFGIPLGKSKMSVQRIELLNAKTGEIAKKVRRVDGDSVAFNLGDARFDMQASQGQSFNNLQGVKQFYLQQFDAVVDKKKGYVEEKQVNDPNQFIGQLFKQADRNGDGKLTRKELEAYLDMIGEGSSAFVTFTVEDHGRSLFNILDANGDGQLSIREMRTAWDRVKPLCKDGQGLVQADLMRTLRITMGQGNSFFRGAVPVAIGGPMMYGRPGKAVNAPAWFQKMDRNGDGDISPREWLGTEEEFRMIDTDGDGLISAEEARQYEARRKKAEPPGKQDASKESAPPAKKPEPAKSK